jgi:hypothetical protein
MDLSDLVAARVLVVADPYLSRLHPVFANSTFSVIPLGG